MNIDVIVTTYNRPEKLEALVKELTQILPNEGNVIVVDSSDLENLKVQTIGRVLYLRSSHKNQPYQRLLGAKASCAEIILFLDDDLTIIRNDIFQLIIEAFCEKLVVGVSVAFEYHNATLDNLDSSLFENNSRLTRAFLKFTGVPSLEAGEIGRLGVTGGKPLKKSEIQSFNGANMAFRRNIIEKIIPEDLLSQAELRLSMGEDKVISMQALQYGKLIYLPEICLQHPPNESTYFQDIRSYTAKVVYSRLYLSWIYTKVFHVPFWKEVVIFYWFTIWRLLIALVSCFVKPSKGRKEKVIGTLDGLRLSLKMQQKADRLTPDLDWQAEITKDLGGAKIKTQSGIN